MTENVSIDLITSQIPHMNMNGSFARASNGEIHFVYCRSASRSESVLCRVRSADEGLSWSRPEVMQLWDEPQNEPCIYCPATSILALQDGGMLIAYQRFNYSRGLGLFIRVSRDGGNTWLPEMIVDAARRGWFLVSNDRLVQTASGRILLPACCHTSVPFRVLPRSFTDLSSFDRSINRYGMVQFYFSDDGGETWSAGDSMLSINVPVSSTGLQEPGVVRLRRGALMCYARTDLGRQYEAFSGDDGKSWSRPEPSSLSSSCSTAIIRRVPDRETLVAIWNPVPNYITLEQDSLSIRQRMICAFSEDEGASWDHPTLIEDDPTCEFSHPALFVGQDFLLVSYNVMPARHSRNFGIRVRRLPLRFSHV